MNIANVPHPYLPPLQNHNAYKLGSDLIQLLAILQKPHVPWIVFLIINLSIVTKFRESPIQSKIVWKKKIKNVDDILYILPYYTTPPPSLHQNQTKIVKIKEKAEWLVPYFTFFLFWDFMISLGFLSLGKDLRLFLWKLTFSRKNILTSIRHFFPFDLT